MDFQEYPKYVTHPEQGSRVVKDAEEEARFLGLTVDWPIAEADRDSAVVTPKRRGRPRKETV